MVNLCDVVYVLSYGNCDFYLELDSVVAIGKSIFVTNHMINDDFDNYPTCCYLDDEDKDWFTDLSLAIDMLKSEAEFDSSIDVVINIDDEYWQVECADETVDRLLSEEFINEDDIEEYDYDNMKLLEDRFMKNGIVYYPKRK